MRVFALQQRHFNVTWNDSRNRFDIWVEFVEFLSLALRGLSLGTPTFLFPQNELNFFLFFFFFSLSTFLAG